MCNMVASYQEPSEIPEGKQIDEHDTEIVWKQNTLTNTTNQQQTAGVNPALTKIHLGALMKIFM